jgi:hypothetical protein
MANIINIYNNTVHSAFDNKYTPQQVQDDVDLEFYFVRGWTDKAKKVNQLRGDKGLKALQEGNIVLIHYPASTFQKRRRNFDTLATFIEYENQSNIVVELLNDGTKIIIPEFWATYVSNDRASIPYNYNLMQTRRLSETKSRNMIAVIC